MVATSLTTKISHDLFPLTLQGLSCVRGETLVFSNINLSLKSGDVCVVRGANGAGKTSLLRLLAGLNKPYQGKSLWSDSEPVHQVPYRAILIGHQDSLKPTLTAAENLEFWAAFSGIKAITCPKPHDPFKITEFIDRPVRTLSAGQKRRVSLTRLLFSRANLWLLDEPTTALDAAAQNALWNLIAAHRVRGGAAIISTHSNISIHNAIELNLGTSS